MHLSNLNIKRSFPALIVVAMIVAGCSTAHFDGFDDAPPIPDRLQSVHNSVLSRFRYTIQPPGMSGYDPDSRLIWGDCEAWTYAVQVELRAHGIPGGEMYDRSSNPGHAVAYAVVDGDVWILDHRHRSPVFADRLPRFDDVPIDF